MIKKKLLLFYLKIIQIKIWLIKRQSLIVQIMNIKIPKKSKLDDELAKKIGAKNLEDLSQKVKDQISNQYIMALNSVTKEILDQLENSHKLEIPKNLIDNEVKSLPNTPETKDKDDEEKIKAAEKKNKVGVNIK